MRRKKPTPESQDKEGPVSLPNGDTVVIRVPKQGRASISIGPKKPEPKEAPKGKKTRPKLIVGGHAIEAILNPRAKEEVTQLDLWDSTKEHLEQKEIELVNRKGRGIQLSKGETRLLFALYELLSEKTPNANNPKGADYFTGNKGAELQPIMSDTGNRISLRAPKFSTTLHELTRRHFAIDRPGGQQQKIVLDMLTGLADDPSKKCLLRWTRQTTTGKDSRTVVTVEEYAPIVKLYNVQTTEESKGKTISQHTEIHIALHPIMTDQVSTKFVPLLDQFTKRMIEAYGGPNVSEISQKLIFELFQALSNRSKLEQPREGIRCYTIGKKKLIAKIAPNYIAPNKSRPQLIEEYLQKGIETAKRLGILEDVKETKGAGGDLMLCFELVEEWD
jgi:hypothetical protein